MNVVKLLLKRDSTDADIENPDDTVIDPGTEEMYQSWALFILLALLIASLWTSYYLQSKKIHAIHESVLSIFGGMFVGLVVRLSPGHFIQSHLKFSHSYFFNILLPPIILNSGYELNQSNFFRNIFSILMFAFAGTFIATMILGVLLWVWTALGLEGIELPLVDAIAVGATLSATDPVTILSIFTAHKVDPKLYTIIFGESLLNDAVCIVIFETAQRLRGDSMTFSALFRGIGIFLITFTVSLLIGVLSGVLTTLTLKHTRVRRYPQIESCLVLLFAYATYFLSNGCHMSGIVSLLFCGITLKHYAYFNMTRRTQIAVKYIFKLLAQLSENFIFIYLGLTLFTQDELVFRPMLIIVTALGICVSRYSAVFPLSKLINNIYGLRNRYVHSHNRGASSGVGVGGGVGGSGAFVEEEEIPEQYQFMLFWAGLRGAVGVALAAGLEGEYANQLRAAVLVVVVLTVIVFGGTITQMLELFGIRTGVEQEADSDDEFDLESANAMGAGRYSGFHSSSTSLPRAMDSDLDEPVYPGTASPSYRAPEGPGSRWFSELDSKVFKPVLLDRGPN